MVRVLLFDVFKESKIFGTKEEPICSCSVGPFLFFATRTQILCHYSQERFAVQEEDAAPPQLIGSLKTIGSVVKLMYLPNVDALLTLEREDTYSTIGGQVCRLYSNWRVACGLIPPPSSSSPSPSPSSSSSSLPFSSTSSSSSSSSSSSLLPEEDTEPTDSVEVNSLEAALNASDTDQVVSAFTIPLCEDARDLVICTTGKKFGIVTKSDIHVFQLQRFPPPETEESSSEGGVLKQKKKHKEPLTRRELAERRKKRENEETKRETQSLVCLYCIQTNQLPFERVAMSGNYVAFVLCESDQASPFVIVLDITVENTPSPLPSRPPSPPLSSSAPSDSDLSDPVPSSSRPNSSFSSLSPPPSSSLPGQQSPLSSPRLKFELTPYFKMKDFMELDRILPAENPLEMATHAPFSSSSSSSSFFSDSNEPEMECIFGENGTLLCPTIPTIALVEELPPPSSSSTTTSPRDTRMNSGGGSMGGESFVVMGGSSKRGYLVWSNDAFGYHVVSVKEVLREECELNFGPNALLLAQFLPEYSPPAPPFVAKAQAGGNFPSPLSGFSSSRASSLSAASGLKQSGTCFMFTNSRDGKIFDLETKKQIAQYQFSEEISGVLTDGVFLYTYNSNKLEVYTMRSSICHKEAKECPDICLIGMSPLMRVADVVVHNYSLIVISKESALSKSERRGRIEPHMLSSVSKNPETRSTGGPGSDQAFSSSSSSSSSLTSLSTLSSTTSAAISTSAAVATRGFGYMKKMFSKTPTAGEQSAQAPVASPPPQMPEPKRSLSWSVYMVRPLPLDDLTNQMNTYAEAFQESNLATYYHLILENRFIVIAFQNRLCHEVALLALTNSSRKRQKTKRRPPKLRSITERRPSQTTVACDWSEGEDQGHQGEFVLLSSIQEAVAQALVESFERYNRNLSKSGEKLAHYHFDEKQYIASSLLFGCSSAPFEYVLEKILESIKEAPFGGGKKAFLLYIDKMLFDLPFLGDVSTSEEFGNRILEQMINIAPQKLAPLVMESRLRNFSMDFVLKLLHILQLRLDGENEGGHSVLSQEKSSQGKDEDDFLGDDWEILGDLNKRSPSLTTVVKKNTYMDPKNLFLKTILLVRKNETKEAVGSLSLFEPELLFHLSTLSPVFLFSTDILEHKGFYSNCCISQGKSSLSSPDSPSRFSRSIVPVKQTIPLGRNPRFLRSILDEKYKSSNGTDLAGLMLLYSPWLLFEVVLSLVLEGKMSVLTALSSLDLERVSFEKVAESFQPHYLVLMESFIEEVMLNHCISLSDNDFEQLLSRLIALYFSHSTGTETGRYPHFSVKELADADQPNQLQPGEAIEILSHQNTEERLSNHSRRFSDDFPEWISNILQLTCQKGKSFLGSVKERSSIHTPPFSLETLSTEHFYPLKILGFFSSLSILPRLKKILGVCAPSSSSSALPSLPRSPSAAVKVRELLGRVLTSEWILHQLTALSLLDKREEVIKYLLSIFPSALLPYCEFWVSDVEEWKGVIQTLMSVLERGCEEEKRERINSALDKVLYYLAHNVEFRTFVNLIPEEGSVMYFLPYMEMAMQKNNATLLKNHLLQKAEASLMKEMEEHGLV